MDDSIKATIKGYEDRLEAVQRALVQAKVKLERQRDKTTNATTRDELKETIDNLTAQISEIDDIVACLCEDREDEKGA